jgi:MraZ protein
MGEQDQRALGTVGTAVSGVFTGNYLHSLDPKKRLTIPSEWRDQVGMPSSLYVLPGIDQHYLLVVPARDMAQRIASMRGHSVADSRARQFARVLGSRSQLVPWDSQGRIRVNDELMAYAQLSSQVALVGALEAFELWNPDLWKATGSMDQSHLGEAARYVGF